MKRQDLCSEGFCQNIAVWREIQETGKPGRVEITGVQYCEHHTFVWAVPVDSGKSLERIIPAKCDMCHRLAIWREVEIDFRTDTATATGRVVCNKHQRMIEQGMDADAEIGGGEWVGHRNTSIEFERIPTARKMFKRSTGNVTRDRYESTYRLVRLGGEITATRQAAFGFWDERVVLITDGKTTWALSPLKDALDTYSLLAHMRAERAAATAIKRETAYREAERVLAHVNKRAKLRYASGYGIEDAIEAYGWNLFIKGGKY
jgi:hypothetical protein